MHYISPELAWTLGDDEAPALVNHEFANSFEQLYIQKCEHQHWGKSFNLYHLASSTILLQLVACPETYYITFTILFAALASAVATSQGTQCGAG